MKNGDNISINIFVIGLNDIINQSAEVVGSFAMFMIHRMQGLLLEVE